MFQGTPLEAVGDRRKAATLQTFILQRQPFPVTGGLIHSGNGRHPVVLQPGIHHLQIGIGMGMLRPRIRKEDQAHRDTVLVQPDQKGGAVGAAPIGNHIDASSPPSVVRRSAVCVEMGLPGSLCSGWNTGWGHRNAASSRRPHKCLHEIRRLCRRCPRRTPDRRAGGRIPGWKCCRAPGRPTARYCTGRCWSAHS